MLQKRHSDICRHSSADLPTNVSNSRRAQIVRRKRRYYRMITPFCGKDYVVLFLPFAHLEQKDKEKERKSYSRHHRGHARSEHALGGLLLVYSITSLKFLKTQDRNKFFRFFF